MISSDRPDGADEAWAELGETLEVPPDPGAANAAAEAVAAAEDQAQLAKIELRRQQAEAELDGLHSTARALAVAPGAMPNSVIGAMTGPIGKWRTFFTDHRRIALERAAGRPSAAADAAAAALAALDEREAALQEPRQPPATGPKKP